MANMWCETMHEPPHGLHDMIHGLVYSSKGKPDSNWKPWFYRETIYTIWYIPYTIYIYIYIYIYVVCRIIVASCPGSWRDVNHGDVLQPLRTNRVRACSSVGIMYAYYLYILYPVPVLSMYVYIYIYLSIYLNLSTCMSTFRTDETVIQLICNKLICI